MILWKLFWKSAGHSTTIDRYEQPIHGLIRVAHVSKHLLTARTPPGRARGLHPWTEFVGHRCRLRTRLAFLMLGQLMFTRFRIVQNIFWGVQILWLNLEAIVLSPHFLHFPTYYHLMPSKDQVYGCVDLVAAFLMLLAWTSRKNSWRRHLISCGILKEIQLLFSYQSCKFIKFNLNNCCVSRVLGVDFEMSAGRESIRITTWPTTQRGASTCGGFGQTLRKGTWSPRWGATPFFWGWQMSAQKLWILDIMFESIDEVLAVASN